MLGSEVRVGELGSEVRVGELGSEVRGWCVGV